MIEEFTNCNTSSLNVFVPSATNSWTKEKIRHLYRRTSFGATYEMIQSALTKKPSEVV